MKKAMNFKLLALLLLTAILSVGAMTTFAMNRNGDYGLPQQERNETEINEFLASASEHLFEGFDVDVLQQIIDEGEQIYQYLRVFSDTEGTRTYRVPVQIEEIEYVIAAERGIAPMSTDGFQRTIIRGEDRSDADSIVIVIFGDGFTECQYGTWDNGNPARNTVLWHANNVINSLVNTHPFSLFEHLLKVYVVHAHGPNAAGAVGYLGTITADGETVRGTVSTTQFDRINSLAHASVASPNYIDMIQVISNATDGTGWARMPWHYFHSRTIAVTSVRSAQNPIGGSSSVWPNGTAFHGTFIHEFGHSFGNLADEHDGATNHNNRRANVERAAVADEDVKWRHWAGHRNVMESPRRFDANAGAGWAIPTIGRVGTGTSGCLMVASWGNRNFCGVCAAELTRRMAFISGETFMGRSPSTVPPPNSPPHTATVTIPQGSTRILDSAFHGNTTLQTIHIPESVNTIGDFAFIGATGLRTIFNFNETPQQINAAITFASLNPANINVIIPRGTAQAYYEAGWAGFNLVENNVIADIADLAFNGTSFTYGTVEIIGCQALAGIRYIAISADHFSRTGTDNVEIRIVRRNTVRGQSVLVDNRIEFTINWISPPGSPPIPGPPDGYLFRYNSLTQMLNGITANMEYSIFTTGWTNWTAGTGQPINFSSYLCTGRATDIAIRFRNPQSSQLRLRIPALNPAPAYLSINWHYGDILLSGLRHGQRYTLSRWSNFSDENISAVLSRIQITRTFL